MPYVSVDRTTIANDLRTYGEGELADHVVDITEGQRVQIGWATGRYWDGFDGARGMQLRRAVAFAAVEVLEGQARPLKRLRARLESAT